MLRTSSMYHRLFARSVLTALTVLLLSACGDEPASPEQSEQDACETALTKLCDRACTCTAGDACDLADGQGTVIGSDNRAECLQLIKLFCSSEESRPIDVAQCSDDIDAASCEAQTDGDLALIQPASCDPPQ